MRGVGSSQTLIESWNGSTWSVTPSPSPGNLDGVTCMNPNNCVAVGGLNTGVGSSQTLIESWNGQYLVGGA